MGALRAVVIVGVTVLVNACSAAEHALPGGYGGGWRLDAARSVAGEDTVSFALALRPARENAQVELERIALRVSDPDSAEYGQHLTGAAIAELTSPAPGSVAAVEAWLSGAEDVRFRRANEYVEVEGPVASLEQLLETQFHYAINPRQNQERVRAGTFRLPAAVEGAVEAVFGLHGLPLPKRAPAAAPLGGLKRRVLQSSHVGGPPANVTPAVLIKSYGITGVSVPAGGSKTKQAVAEFQGQCMNQTDLVKFWDQFVMGIVPGATEENAMVQKYLGQNDKCQGQTEPSLDIQYLVRPATICLNFVGSSIRVMSDRKMGNRRWGSPRASAPGFTTRHRWISAQT